LEVPHPWDNNNGGQLFFRTDFFPDYLYITLGDGGGVSDPNNNAQRLDSLLGKILRIDVSTHPYSVPCLNPFNSEVFAYGFRNPWRCSVNRKNQSEIFCGDSGQDGEEEIDIISKGGNYGWRIMEGNNCFIPPTCDKTNFTAPVYSYILDSPVSAVIGGVVVHTPGDFEGKYIFADLGEGLMVLENNKAEFVSPRSDCEQLSDFILSFGDDNENRVFISTTASFALNDKDGSIYEIQFSNGFKELPKFSLIIFFTIFISYIIL
jgi:glucose/arabinose dehydrogenase